MPFLSPNQQCQSTEGNAKTDYKMKDKVTLCEQRNPPNSMQNPVSMEVLQSKKGLQHVRLDVSKC